MGRIDAESRQAVQRYKIVSSSLHLRAQMIGPERSRTDIRKFKQWLDAEYTVVGVDNSRMRLAVDGIYGEHDAMANIWIEHKGTRVSVGSGFTTEQRIRYGQRPQDIVSAFPDIYVRAR